MRATLILALVTFLTILLSCDATSAQPYGFGPGGLRVWAPGVGVYVGRSGGVSVRAPWTSVYVPGYRYGAWYVRPGLPYPPPYGPWYGLRPPAVLVPARPASAVPTAAELATMSWGELRYLLRVGAARLDQELDRFKTAASWHRYLQVAELRDLMAEDLDAPPDEQTLAKLADALRAYDAAQANEGYGMIAGLTGFRTVHAALVEFQSSPDERLRKRLVHSAGRLQQSLALSGRRAGWGEYLQLPADIIQRDQQTDPVLELEAAPDVGELEQALSRFNEVSSDPRFGWIARLPEFRATHSGLSAYVALLRGFSTGETGSELPFEELPPPVEQ